MFMKIFMAEKYSSVSPKTFLTPFCSLYSLPFLPLRVANDLILVNEIKQKYFEWLIGKNFYFLVIVKQFYIIPWKRPSPLLYAFEYETRK